ncbi:MAG: GNAT family N-acetyltransferase [Rhodovulum sulfidophilum]|uniref:GNAT family N-acetyltransferase n=1 Tax=Rhodovulum sulfidophilum TaxID=35806 RepID=A0A2W5NNY5_RHOSU|nr:MAG: GNAT family N-acetyltransferase [Rhodovulum sulfidophilum]
MDYFETLEATWPGLTEARDGWTLRRATGAGSRASAATRVAADADPRAAEAAMRAMGQRPLFMIRAGDADLDAALAGMGYTVEDASALLAAPAEAVATEGAEFRVVRCEAPLARMIELWDAGGIGPARRAVMARARGPRVYLLARDGDRPAGCAFVAADGRPGGGAMIHALSVAPFARRKGLARRATAAAAAWAAETGAAELALAVRLGNEPALALYRGLGFREAARYHYRSAPA